LAKCESCGREFATEVALAQHIKDKHGLVEGATTQGQAARKGSQKAGRPKPRSLRKRNRHPVAIGIASITVAVGLVLYLLVAPNFAGTFVRCLTAENYIHVHPYLRISILGSNVPIPAQIGFLKNGQCIEQIHNHDTSGIIHIELGQSDVNANYTLSDFFRVWNATFPTISFNGTSHPVTFSNNDILGYQTDATHKVIVLVDNATVVNGSGVPLEQLDYCNSGIPARTPPCYPTTANTTGSITDPLWNGTTNYPYGTGHTIVIEYVKI
jgi:hypothetical protein